MVSSEESSSESIVQYALAGNGVIAFAKMVAATSSGSSAMWAEAVHSVVDCANQGLLLIGLRQASMRPSEVHPYGYGKSVYFWSLVSALGTFWLGAGVTVASSLNNLVETQQIEIGWEVWSVLSLSLGVDGYVLSKSVRHLYRTKPQNETFFEHVRTLKDPTVLAVLLEDGAACAGVVMASAGIAGTHATGIHAIDAMSGVAVGILLGTVGITLAAVNGKFLIGSAVDKDVVDDIDRLIRTRPGVDGVHSAQSMWVGPSAFSYKCEVHFDGTWIAAQLYDRYESHFYANEHLPVLLSFYAEDVLRTVEYQVQEIEAIIRSHHPQALFIELEPSAPEKFDHVIQPFTIETNYNDPKFRQAEFETLDGFLEDARREDEYQNTRRGYLDDDDSDHYH